MVKKSDDKGDLRVTHRDAIQLAGELIRRARNGVVLTGAGISTPSGIPDFRSTESGLWTRYDPMQVASLTAFRHSPERFFAWIRPLAEQIFRAEPNPAHLALVELEKAGFIRTIITQNIDGLHQRAGSANVIEVHGTLDELTCVRCFGQIPVGEIATRFLNTGEIPRCPSCQGILKPNVVLFEEQLPLKAWLQADLACRECDLMMVIGSSLEVVPVAGLPMCAAERDVPLILVNYTPTYIDIRAQVVLHDDLALVVPLIVEAALDDRD